MGIRPKEMIEGNSHYPPGNSKLENGQKYGRGMAGGEGESGFLLKKRAIAKNTSACGKEGRTIVKERDIKGRGKGVREGR